MARPEADGMQRLMQLALDFLGGDTRGADAGAMPPTRRSLPGGPPPLRISRPKVPAAQEPPAQDAIDSGASALLQHPGANREALLCGRRVAYAFARGRRRTIGFSVGPDGLTVRAPGWVPLHQVDAALLEKAEWIVRKLGEMDDRRGRQQAARINWGDGACFPYLGRTVAVALVGAARGVQATRLCAVAGGAEANAPFGERAASSESVPAEAAEDSGAPRAEFRLELRLPADSPPAAVAAAVRAWLLREARTHFTARLDHFAPLLGVQWTRLGLTSARTRWGSASGNGTIRLHWRLLHFRPAVVDYVVAHELAHLRHMDHSPRFWATVATVVPDYALLRGELRQDTAPRWTD